MEPNELGGRTYYGDEVERILTFIEAEDPFTATTLQSQIGSITFDNERSFLDTYFASDLALYYEMAKQPGSGYMAQRVLGNLGVQALAEHPDLTILKLELNAEQSKLATNCAKKAIAKLVRERRAPGPRIRALGADEIPDSSRPDWAK